MTHPSDLLLAGGSVFLGKEDAFHIPLGIGCVVVLSEAGTAVVGIPETKGLALLIVGEDHDDGGIPIGEAFLYNLAVLGNIGMDDTVYDLPGTDAVYIVVVGIGLVVGGQTCKLSAVLPCQIGVELLTVAVVVGLPISSYTGAWVVYP